MVAEVNVTEFPWQKGLLDAEIEILTGRFGLTIMLIALLVAGFPVGHRIFEVRIQETWSPETGMQEYTGEFVPTLIPLTFHR